jgi:choice-of-anchor B domain-containing protein
MKLNWLIIFCLFSLGSLSAQEEAILLGQWNDSTLVGSTWYDNTYNEVWGVAVNGREYAVVGSTAGTHFIDVTDPNAPEQVQFVPGAAQGGGIIHRDYHDYGNYLYAVCDEGPSTMQIMDISQLPDTVLVPYDTNAEIRTAHNIFIDTATAKLYAFALNGGSLGYSAMRIYDISEPLNPQAYGEYNNFGGLFAGHVHDGYVRDDIAFLNCGTDGFAIVDFSDPTEPRPISTLTDYPARGYNHSGWLTDDAQYYYMGDENHGYDIKAIEVADPCEPTVRNTFNAEVPNPSSIPHNQVVACNYLYVPYYYDGLVVYDISDPANPEKVLYYDTSNEPEGNSYKGAWGVYPFLPSGNILVTDMQEGLFVFEAIDADCAATQQLEPVDLDCLTPTSTNEFTAEEVLRVFPQPASSRLQVEWSGLDGAQPLQAQLYATTGQLVQSWQPTAFDSRLELTLPDGLGAGVYVLRLRQGGKTVTTRVLVQ